MTQAEFLKGLVVRVRALRLRQSDIDALAADLTTDIATFAPKPAVVPPVEARTPPARMPPPKPTDQAQASPFQPSVKRPDVR